MHNKFVCIALCLQFGGAALAQDTAPSPALLSNGKYLYEEYAGCASCHGNDGKGKVEGVTLNPPPPDLSDCGFNTREPRRDWRAVINRGGPARGLSMSMPAYEEALTAEQVEVLIDYLKTFCSERGWPPGELNFRRAQVTAKAFPENEALFIPQYERGANKTMTTKFVYERRWSRRAQWEISVPFVAEWQTPKAQGIGGVELSAQYVLLHNLAAQTILSGGVEAALPTGESRFGGNAWKLSPFLAAGKNFSRMTWQSNIKLEQPLQSDAGESELLFNFALTVPLTREKKGFFPTIEANAATDLESGTTQWLLTPQLYIGLVRRGHIAFSGGAQIPLAGPRPFDYRLVSFFLWEYGDGGLWW